MQLLQNLEYDKSSWIYKCALLAMAMRFLTLSFIGISVITNTGLPSFVIKLIGVMICIIAVEAFLRFIVLYLEGIIDKYEKIASQSKGSEDTGSNK